MKNQDIQSELFRIIKAKLTGEISLGNALSDILHISPDAVYRRYRGETSLTIQETKKLCIYFDISFDALTNLDKGKVIFQYSPLNTYDFSLESYLHGIAESLNKIRKLTHPQLILSINNTHLLQLFNFPQLLRFRLFFWAKTYLQINDFQSRKFSLENSVNKADKINTLGQEILDLYNSIPSIEIIDPELMRGFMRQILYAYNAHMFEIPDTSLFLCDDVLLFAGHLKQQNVLGQKFSFQNESSELDGELQCYLNETINADTTYYYSSKELDGVFFTHNIMNYLQTFDKNYVVETRQIIDKQLANSSLISIVNEKERNNFFFDFEKMIHSFRKRIDADLHL
jgi:hypothetical protein